MIPNDLITPPSAEPLTLADVKTWLRVDDATDDGLIAGLITSARLTVEAATGLLLISQSWRCYFDQWPTDGRLVLPYRPVHALTSVNLRDQSGTLKAVALDPFSIEPGREPCALLVAGALPTPSGLPNGILIDVVFGFGADGTLVPAPLLAAMRQMIAFWYENRGDEGPQAANTWPSSIGALLHPYRRLRIGA